MNKISNETIETQIRKLMEEVEVYKKAIRDACDVLVSGELEPEETIETER